MPRQLIRKPELVEVPVFAGCPYVWLMPNPELDPATISIESRLVIAAQPIHPALSNQYLFGPAKKIKPVATPEPAPEQRPTRRALIAQPAPEQPAPVRRRPLIAQPKP